MVGHLTRQVCNDLPSAVIFVTITSTTIGNVLLDLRSSGYVIFILGGVSALFLLLTPYDLLSKLTLMSIANTIYMSIFT